MTGKFSDSTVSLKLIGVLEISDLNIDLSMVFKSKNIKIYVVILSWGIRIFIRVLLLVIFLDSIVNGYLTLRSLMRFGQWRSFNSNGGLMRIVTLNCNGIRAAARKGFFEWLPSIKADVVCLQETRASEDQLDTDIFWPKGYFCYYFDALKK